MIQTFCSRIALCLLVFLNLACSENKPEQSKGLQLLEEKKYTEALNWYNKQIEDVNETSELKELYYGRALTHHRMHNLDLAINDVNWALVIDSSNTRYREEKGDLFYEKHLVSDAIKQYQINLMLEPTEGRWYYKTGKCRLMRNDLGSAMTDFEKAEKMGCKDDDLYLQMGIVFQRAGNQDRCCSYFKKSAALGNKEAERFFKNLGCL